MWDRVSPTGGHPTAVPTPVHERKSNHGRRGDRAAPAITPCQAVRGSADRREEVDQERFWRSVQKVSRSLVSRMDHAQGAWRARFRFATGPSLQNRPDVRNLAGPQGSVGRPRPGPGTPYPPHRAPYPGCPTRDPRSEAHVPTQQSPQKAQARVPASHPNAPGPRHSEQTAPEGPPTAFGLSR